MGWVLFCFTLPWSVTVGWGWVGIALALGIAVEPRFEEHGILTARWTLQVAKIWRYSTTLGRGIIYQPGARRVLSTDPMTRTEQHERIHVEQVEDLMLLGLLLGLVVWGWTGNWFLGLMLWWSAGAWQLPNFVTAAMRFGWKNAYRFSEHERSAYSQSAVADHSQT